MAAFVQPPQAAPAAREPELATRRGAWQALTMGAAPGVLGLTMNGQAAWAFKGWSGQYDDPKHPGCLRQIIKDGDQFIISGSSSRDGSKECTGSVKTQKRWSLVGTTNGDEMTIDFSKKGGPKDAKALLTKDGIKFPDGNKWVKRKERYSNPADSNYDYTKDTSQDALF